MHLHVILEEDQCFHLIDGLWKFGCPSFNQRITKNTLQLGVGVEFVKQFREKKEEKKPTEVSVTPMVVFIAFTT